MKAVVIIVLAFSVVVICIMDVCLKLNSHEIHIHPGRRKHHNATGSQVRSDFEPAMQPRTSAEDDILQSARKVHFIFVGYRDHWPNHPPFECNCQNKSILVETLDYDDSVFQNYTKSADCLIFVLASRGRLTSKSWRKLRTNRQGTNQTWLFASRESALTTQSRLSPPKEFRWSTYHMSFTYHTTADIYTPYGRYIQSRTVTRAPAPLSHFKGTLSRIIAKKVHFISWMSSSCGVSVKKWKRTEFARRLSQLMPLHMYGTCGNMTCEKLSQECPRKLSTYKFALVLENSCCSEYITEKFWNAFRFEQVPVVFGASVEEYARLAPPNSYIPVEDFSTVSELTDFLQKIDRNDSLYLKYHEWRNHGHIEVAELPRDFVSSCHSLCRVDSSIDSYRKESHHSFHFDPFGASWHGSCRDCDQIAQMILDT